MKRFHLTLLVVGLVALAAPRGWADDEKCPSDSVEVGPACIDKYEASVWEIPNVPANKSLIRKVKAGKATLANLTSATAIANGVVQRGVGSDDYGAGCPDTGNGCKDFYAVSIPGATPSAFLTWFQAAAAARNSGKRLPTNQEWQAAALGTPDPGASPGPADCNTNSAGPSLTGARGNCVSDVGAFDMVGNLWEWVADWVPLSTKCGSPLFESDLNCIGIDHTVDSLGPGALIRGGDFGNGADAGVFTVHGFFAPSLGAFGFRAAR